MSILHLFVLLKITELTLGSWNDTFLNWERKNLKATVNPVKGQVLYLISWYHQSSGYHFSCGFYSYKQSCSQNFLWVCLHECALECSCLSTGPKWKIIPLKKHVIELLKSELHCTIGCLTLVRQCSIKSLSSVCLSVCPSLHFLKIGSLVFCDIVHDDSWPWILVTDEARFLRKK